MGVIICEVALDVTEWVAFQHVAAVFLEAKVVLSARRLLFHLRSCLGTLRDEVRFQVELYAHFVDVFEVAHEGNVTHVA